MYDKVKTNGDCYTFYMEPDRVGRKLGIGVRVAGSMLRDRATQTAHSIQQEAPVYKEQSRVAARGAKKGARKFGQAVWGPFAHASGVLWLEITGLFFGIFGLFFAQNAYKLRSSWRLGPEHQHFLAYAAVTLVFAYFAFSSFYRARRKERQKRQQAVR
jgi:hypothetical protein